MKYILPLLVATVSVWAADNTPDQGSKTQLPELRTEHHEKYDEQRRIIAYTDTVYRGSGRTRKERILQTVKFKKKNQEAWATWRTFYVDGQAVMLESCDGDGESQTIALIRDNVVCEMFRRQPDGSVEAVSSQELAKVKGEMDDLTGAFGKVMRELRARVETNSPDRVLGELKAELDQYKEKQKLEGEAKKR